MQHEVMQLAEGWDGTDQTVAKATELVRNSLTDPVVRLTAENIVRYLPERDKSAEIRAVSRFVRKNIRYTNEGVETIKTPRLLLDEIRSKGKAVGDCDDHIILWLALHKVLGQRVRIKVVSQRKNKVASHIWGQVYNPDTHRWVSDDTIKKDKAIGWDVPHGKRTAEKTYYDSMEGFSMSGYQTLPQSGTWRPGGAGRFYVNPQQRPGIREGQLSVGRNLLPSNIQVRNASALESQGVGFVMPDFSGMTSRAAATITSPEGQAKLAAMKAPSSGFDLSSLVSAAGSIVEAGGRAFGGILQTKAAQKAADREAKERRQIANTPNAGPFIIQGGGGGSFSDNLPTIAIAGAVGLIFLLMLRK